MRNQYNGQNGNGYQPVEPPKPPPMRIGQRGDTIDADGVRRDRYGCLVSRGIWQNLCRCKSCNSVKDWAPFGSRHENAFPHLRFCADCGESQGWYDDVCRWVSFAVWWKPSTWGTGVWVSK